MLNYIIVKQSFVNHSFLPLLFLSACAGASFDGQVYRDQDVAFRVGALGAGWERFRISEAALAFRHGSSGTIVANAMCKDIDDVPLDVLTNQALFGVNERHELGRSDVTLDGRAARRTQVTGTMDGVPVALDLVVMKKNNCVFDFQLVSSPADFAARQTDFVRFISGFANLKSGT